jgi:hypothetical protein
MDAGPSRRLVAEGKYEFSKHAEREREADMIPVGSWKRPWSIVRSSRIIPMILGGRVVWCLDSQVTERSTQCAASDETLTSFS